MLVVLFADLQGFRITGHIRGRNWLIGRNVTARPSGEGAYVPVKPVAVAA